VVSTQSTTRYSHLVFFFFFFFLNKYLFKKSKEQIYDLNQELTMERIWTLAAVSDAGSIELSPYISAQ
jgi:hypothetical protein